VTSPYIGPIEEVTPEITAIGPISGDPRVGVVLAAGTLTPAEATAVYQWQRSNGEEGPYENIPGAASNNYTLTVSDYDCYIRVVATGTGSYTGAATSAYKGPVAAGQITAIGPISGTTALGQTLTAGTLTPFGATASYQWQRSNGTEPFSDIAGATSGTYTLTGSDSNCYIRVVATGIGAYAGTVASEFVGKVGAAITPLTSMDPIGGTAEVGQTLTAGTLSPTGAIATYQWRRANTANGTYENIPGATASSYTLTPADKDKFIKVAAIGSGTYSGTLVSAYKGPVAGGQLAAIGPISGTTVVGQTLTAGTLTPFNATVTYQWQRCISTNGTYEDISNANASAYTLTASDEGYFIRVVATAEGAYTGTLISAYTGPVGVTTTPVTAIGAISGITQMTQTLTAGTVDPSGATVTYQWLRCDTADGVYENIFGATAISYTLTTADMNKYIKVRATGSGTYSGTATSAYKGPVAAGQITAIGAISGTTSVGQTLTVGTLTPFGATASYQWQRSNGTSAFADIVGGTASAYTLTGSDSNYYIRVVATGTGAYTGTVISDYVGRVGATITPLTSISPIGGTATVGQTLTAGTVSPTGAIVTYQWRRAGADGIYGNIPGATANSYTLTAADKDKYIKVAAIGSGNYSGTVLSAYIGPVTAGQLTAIGPISGTTVVGQTLTAGTLTPYGATATYQWQRCSTTNGTYEDILNANASTYTLKASDEGHFIRVVAAAEGAFTGTLTSAYTGPVGVTTTPVTTIGAISGIVQVTQTLTAGTVDPSGATVTYQWQRSDTDVGTYENIPGATSYTYTLAAADMNKYIRVQAMGSGIYSGTATSTSKGPVAAGQITAIGPISGTTSVGQTLTVGTLTPFGATASYQWQRSNAAGSFVDIVGGTASAYTLTGEDSWCYIRIVAMGTGAYTGTVFSDYVGRVVASATPLTAIGPIGGTTTVGQTLTAGTVSPTGAIVTYQWRRADAVDGTYGNIPGATANSYTLTAADKDKYIKVAATGSGNYSGTVTSAYKGPVTAGQLTAIGPISGTTAVGQTLAAGTLTPSNATVNYQWQRCINTNGTYENMLNANASTYTLKESDVGYFIRVVVTATGSYTGTAISAYTGPVGITTIPVTAIGAISGTAQVTQTLTAGTVDPSGATVTYQWLRCDTADGVYENIPGATSKTCTLTTAEMNKYIKVQATGSGSYSGTATSTYKGPAAAGQITDIGPIGGTTSVGQTLTVGTLTPYGATASYQWQRSNSTGSFVDIIGGTASAYTLMGEDSWCYIRVVATGTGAYTGTVISDFAGRVVASSTPLTAIGAISGTARIGETLTAGILSPTGAKATYQWQSTDTPGGIYGNILGATTNSYTLTAADKDKYIKVVATGSGNYSGTVTSTYKGPVTAGLLTAIGPVNGAAAVGQTLTAGTLTPINATVNYQWQRCADSNGTYEDVLNANASTYTLKESDVGYFIRVVADAAGSYTGTVISGYTGPVGITTIPVTAIGAISGTARVAQILTAGTVYPSGATVTYQWLRCDTADGVYENIPGATSNTYMLTPDEKNHYIKVRINGSGTYSDTVTSAYKGPVAAGQLTYIGSISGTTSVGQTLTVGTLTPYGATASYQWQRSDSNGGVFTDITGGTASAYTLMGNDSWRYIRVKATGTGAYTGTVYSARVGRVVDQITPLISIGAIDGIAEVGQVLTAGTLNPAGTATYQWLRADTADGIYENIAGATAGSYTLTAADKNKHIKVSATGNGTYSGTVTSTSKGPVAAGRLTAIGSISGTTMVGQTLAAGTLTPLTATVNYQWQRCATADGIYENILNATAISYTLKTIDDGKYIKVVATGTDAYTGTAESNPTGPVGIVVTPITAIEAISGTAQVGMTLTAGTVSPSGATVTYQWQKSDTDVGEYEDIPGATSDDYTLTAADMNKYIKVQVTGSGSFSGMVISTSKGPVEVGQITAISDIIGTAVPGQTLTAGTVSPLGATVTYQWLKSGSAGGTYSDIGGATSNTYSLSSADNGSYIKVRAIGTDAYEGTVTSNYTGPVSGATTALTAIGAISGTAEVGQTLTAGTLNPSAATVTYQWQRCETADGDYVNIPGAASSTYLVSENDTDKYLRVKATGSGKYAGTVTSAYVGPVTAMPGMFMMMAPMDESTLITDINADSETYRVGETLAAELSTPTEVTVLYQWQRSDAADGTYEDIEGATEDTYILTEDDIGCFIRVTVTGTDGNMGFDESDPIGPVEPSTPITAIDAISGKAQIGRTLEAGTLNPGDGEATYQWQSCDTADGIFENIVGAEESSYTLTDQDETKYIQVVATGTGAYTGTVTSAAIGPVEPKTIITDIGGISGINQVGETLTAGTLNPPEATAVYQWQRSAAEGEDFTDIAGATSNTYILSEDDYNKYVRVVATGTGGYTGTVASAYVGPIIDSVAAAEAAAKAEAEAAAKAEAAKAEAGDPEVGDPEVGDLELGDPEVGDPEAGDPEAGDPEVGDPEDRRS